MSIKVEKLINLDRLTQYDGLIKNKIKKHSDIQASDTVSGHVKVDTELSDTSTNPVQNKAVKNALDSKVPITRTVNGKALSSNISLSASDVGADPSGSSNSALSSAKSYTDAQVSTVNNTLTSHTGNTSNPHSVTKAQVGLGNVENKSSATIRGELTKTNVTNALGYAPYTPNEVDNKIATLETNIDWKETVATYSDIATTYPNPVDGWTVNVKDTDYTYRYNGTSWIAISANVIPKATNSIDGLLTKEDHTKYEDANSKKHTHDNKAVIDGITSTLVSNWNAAKTHADSAHARTDATKVEKSSTNGNIKINGTETVVYTHPSGTNPHGTTQSDVGLGNVNNTADKDKYVKGILDYADTSRSIQIGYAGAGLTVDEATHIAAYTEDGHKIKDLSFENLKTKLGLNGAEPNQNAFSNIVVGSTTIEADTKTDTLTLVAGSNVTLTPDATNDKITISSTDTNDKVTQTAVTDSDYTNWRSLIWGASNSGTEGFAPTTVTDGVYSCTGLSVQPSSGTIRASVFKGNLSGNATTASKWDTPRTLSLTGAVTGSVSIDGSGDVSLSTSVNHTHNYAGSDSAGGSATSARSLLSQGMLDTQEKIDNFITPNKLQYSLFNTGDTNDIGMESNDGMLLSIPWSSTSYGAQIAIDDSTIGTIKIRGRSNNNWGSWHTLLHSDNYTNYTVTKTGTNASGTWGINITGSAGSVEWGNIIGKPSVFTPADHTHISLKSNTDNRSTDTTPNDYNGVLKISGLKYNDTIGISGHGAYSGVLGMRPWLEESGGNSHEFALTQDGEIFHRHGETTSWNSWRQIAFTSSNVASANKLATARTISLTGSVTGSGSFDGSGNLSITTTTNHTHSYLPLTGGTLTGSLKVNSTIFGYNFTNNINAPAFVFDKHGSHYTGIGANAEYDTIFFGAVNTSDFSWNTGYKQIWKFNGSVVADSFNGNSVSANKLATARTIALTGSVTGSGTFDGSGDLTITTTTNHTHNYLPISGGTMTGQIQKSGVSSSWINGRSSAMIRMNSISGYSPFASIKTTNGSWEIGAYDSPGYIDDLVFSYCTDANFNAGNNSTTAEIKFFNNGHILGSLDGNASTATSATKLNDITASDEASPTDTWRRVWFSYDDNTTGRPAYSNNLCYQSSTGSLNAITFIENGTALSNKYVPLSGNSTVNGAITFGMNDGYGIRTNTNNYGRIGDSTNQFYEVYSYQIYEDKTLLSNKYAPISHSHDYIVGSYTGDGGQQQPNYFGTNKVGFLMMNTVVNGNYNYKDWIIMDCYNGSDVGGGVAFGINRQALGAYIMRSGADRTSWSESAELLHTSNYQLYCAPVSHTHSYLPLSGGTMNGSIKFNSNSLPSKSLEFICGIDAFDSGGEMGWQSKSAFLSDCSKIGHTHNYAGSTSAGGAANYLSVQQGNEINFTNATPVTDLWFNYRNADNGSTSNDTAITTYKFGNKNGSTSGVTLFADSFTGNSASASRLATARTISLTGSVTGSGTFDGSGDLTISTTVSHTHNYAGSTSEGGAANVALGLSPYTISNIDELNSFLSDNFTMKYAKASNCDIGWVSNDGLIISLPWSSTFGAQIAIDDQSNWMGLRSKSNGTWNNWSVLLNSTNYTSYCTPTNIGAAPASHTHSYLPLSGGTMTGVTNYGNGSHSNIMLRTDANWKGGIGWDNQGNEALSLWAINRATSLRWNAGVDMSSMTSGTMMGITPDFEISKADGTAKGYIGGTQISVNGHTHNYAGSSSAGGSATSAVKLDSSAGSATQPIYFSDGKPVSCAYSLGKSVPSDAVFTDTVYTHPTTAGNKHIPSGGSSGQILRWSADGTAVWGDDNNAELNNKTSVTIVRWS